MDRDVAVTDTRPARSTTTGNICSSRAGQESAPASLDPQIVGLRATTSDRPRTASDRSLATSCSSGVAGSGSRSSLTTDDLAAPKQANPISDIERYEIMMAMKRRYKQQ
eukprot:gnl/TRDRNA2_/TRDRNA2_171110_c0_seq1.p1 gnl/TRDRNA2_/TRDRNA2_171110_c0~~gnl/TRDRNA2_/TRDRNA2_171110_c0_seq1.p1  ORF type:complete len:126 (+),score=5.44 gnl/TRDRNA2_/TRDRNA2_171110_c0_seq1:54-380(+)